MKKLGHDSFRANIQMYLHFYFGRKVKWDFLIYFQPLWKKDEIEFATYASTSKDVNM